MDSLGFRFPQNCTKFWLLVWFNVLVDVVVNGTAAFRAGCWGMILAIWCKRFLIKIPNNHM